MIEKFKNGQQYTKVIKAVADEELTRADYLGDDYRQLDCVKFVPASGAATRMFQGLYKYLEDFNETDFIKTFFDNIKSFAFFDNLKAYVNSLDDESTQNRIMLIDSLLTTSMNYGSTPKALLLVHKEGDRRLTPIDEHVYEACEYLNPEKKRLHFTISKEHEKDFCEYINDYIRSDLEITYSFQKDETNTLAVNLDNTPFILRDGKPLYRPGGHGALIENLNDIDADVIFIKNIDNVCHKDYVRETVKWKKRLASVGLQTKLIIDEYLKSIDKCQYDLNEIKYFIEEELNVKLKVELDAELAKKILHRPFRVCGVVKNQGEPGGGPFVVDNEQYTDLQICEKAEIDLSKQTVKKMLDSAAYFNPVDLVCFVKDYKGQKFDLRKYVNEDRYFISQKSFEGKDLKALELPGLWNGAMHHWNTVFMEVPEITFNPIKTVNDLLKKGHCAMK